jgi:hypothetical protein
MSTAQKLIVLNHLRKSRYGMTSWDAIYHYRITRLAARIADLKDDGFKINTVREQEDGKNFARYYLIGEAQ